MTCVCTFLILLLCSVSVSAQNNPTGQAAHGAHAVRDADALALIRLALARNGALGQAKRDTLATGTIHTFRDEQTHSLIIKTSGTDYLRNEVGSDFVFSRAGNEGLVRYYGKDHKPAPQLIAYKRAEHLPMLLLLSEVESPSLQCKDIGKEEVNGTEATHLRLSIVPSDGSDPRIEDLLSETHVWIDSAGLVLKARTFLFSPEAIENRSPVDLYYSDYRQIEGFLVPFHILREVERQKDSEIVFDSIDLNVKFSIADFR